MVTVITDNNNHKQHVIRRITTMTIAARLLFLLIGWRMARAPMSRLRHQGGHRECSDAGQGSSVCMYIYIYIYIYIYVNVYVYIYIYIHIYRVLVPLTPSRGVSRSGHCLRCVCKRCARVFARTCFACTVSDKFSCQQALKLSIY